MHLDYQSPTPKSNTRKTRWWLVMLLLLLTPIILFGLIVIFIQLGIFTPA